MFFKICFRTDQLEPNLRTHRSDSDAFIALISFEEIKGDVVSYIVQADTSSEYVLFSFFVSSRIAFLRRYCSQVEVSLSLSTFVAWYLFWFSFLLHLLTRSFHLFDLVLNQRFTSDGRLEWGVSPSVLPTHTVGIPVMSNMTTYTIYGRMALVSKDGVISAFVPTSPESVKVTTKSSGTCN